MFKIAKILNSGNNVPETVTLPVTASVAYKLGCALKLSSGAAAHCTATDKPAYICAQNRAAAASGFVKAYPVTPDLILECPVGAAPTALTVGAAVTLDIDSGSMAVGVTATTASGVATIYNLEGAAVTGDKLMVRIL